MGLTSSWHWILVLLVVLLLFGTSKLPNVGRDLAKTIKGFNEGMREPDEPAATPPATTTPHSENRPVV